VRKWGANQQEPADSLSPGSQAGAWEREMKTYQLPSERIKDFPSESGQS
jgi:hypothetical protein